MYRKIKMAGKHAFFATAVLILILAFSLLLCGTAMASEASANWHSTNGWPDEWNDDWPDECDISEDVVYGIFQRFNSLNYEWKMWSPGSSTTAYNILSVANSMDTYDYAAVFMYSHGCYYDVYGYLDLIEYQIPVPVEHFRSFMQPSDQSYDDLFDYELGYTNEDGGHHFVYMWTCASAKIRGYWDYEGWVYVPGYGYAWYTGTGAVGYAYSWMRQGSAEGLSENGYANPDQGAYCFLGFEDYSPALTNGTGYNGKTYVDFVEEFYDKALNTTVRRTINQALDLASYKAFGVYEFSQTLLYQGYTAWLPPPANCMRESSMKVFGNGNNYLSTGG
jgi:hypothetical protein